MVAAMAVVPDEMEGPASIREAPPPAAAVIQSLLGLPDQRVCQLMLVGKHVPAVLRFSSFLVRAQQLES